MLRRILPAVLIVGTALFPAAVNAASWRDLSREICRVAIQEESQELADAALEVDLYQSRVLAFESILALIQGLWDAKAIQRMVYLQAKYDFDAARLDLERANLKLDRQRALLEHYRLSCSAEPTEGSSATDRDRALADEWERYRRADCDQQAKAVEVATVNLTFNRELLASVQSLREGQVATKQEVIRAELAVKLEEQRLADAKDRAARCRRALEGEPAR